MSSNNEIYRRRASILSALANPARLHLVDALSTGERTVGDLSAEVGLDISTVSRHLSVLRSAGLAADRKEGTKVYYTLAVRCVLDFFQCVENVIAGGACRLPACPKENKQ
jgi:DNA-binding transcriptional ArsR family regulator